MFPDLKHAIMSPLAMQTVAMRVCTKCHQKSLVWRCSNDFGVWMQCEKCLTVFVLPPDSTGDAATNVGPHSGAAGVDLGAESTAAHPIDAPGEANVDR